MNRRHLYHIDIVFHQFFHSIVFFINQYHRGHYLFIQSQIIQAYAFIFINLILLAVIPLYYQVDFLMYKRIVSLVVVQSYFFYILALAEQIRSAL